MPRSDDPASAVLRRLRQRLLRWFGRHQRDLPWRQDRDPYRIWISEVLLQQTQVATVVPYFERFLRAFPTVAQLAAADEQEVLRLWEGLGYYRRARNLHQAARRIMAERGGSLPDDPGYWLSLPGVGRYTVGAVLSQAFDRRLPIVDANSKRVLSRFFGRQEDPATGPMQRWLWHTAETVLPQRHCGQFNQALMELGALICTPKAPRCAACPIVADCVAHHLGLQEKIPPPRSPPIIEQVQETAVVVWHGQRVLLVQRPSSGRWAGLWEFPHAPLSHGESYEQAGQRLLPSLVGLDAELGQELQTVRHSISRFRITLVCFEARYCAGQFRSDFYVRAAWLEPRQLAAYPISAPQRILANSIASGVRTHHLFGCPRRSGN